MPLAAAVPTTPALAHEEAEVRHLRLRDGVSAAELLRYLRADADYREGMLLRWGNTPPTVRVEEGTPDELVREVHMAVQVINSSLPSDWQLRFDAKPTTKDREMNRGFIDVVFDDKEDWPDQMGAYVSGVAYHKQTGSGEITAGQIFVDPERSRAGRDRFSVLLHELLHTLGRGHVDKVAFPYTIMHARGLAKADLLLLQPIDNAALYAVYDRLEAGPAASTLSYEDLGPWTDVSTHILGRIGHEPGQQLDVFFGAVWKNGNVRPWALGALFSPPLDRSFGWASWNGRMLGLTPEAEAVAGAVDMSVDLSTLHGNIDFTQLEQWAAHTRLGEIGTGSQWGDGDLNYQISVDGSLFHEICGDDGKVTGAFFGPNQERAGGTLRRHDLAAGFGAERQ